VEDVSTGDIGVATTVHDSYATGSATAQSARPSQPNLLGPPIRMENTGNTS
jgi:hypothetical protein